MAEAFICKDQHYEIMTSVEQTLVREFTLNTTAYIDPPNSIQGDSASGTLVFPQDIDYFKIITIQFSNNKTTLWDYETKVINTLTNTKLVAYNDSAPYYYAANSQWIYANRNVTVYLSYDANSRTVTVLKTHTYTLNTLYDTSTPIRISNSENLTVTCEFLVKYSA